MSPRASAPRSTRAKAQAREAHDVVRSWKLWAELASTLRVQANYMMNISDAIRANNVEDTKAALTALMLFVKARQPMLNRLSPAITELMAELFETDGTEG